MDDETFSERVARIRAERAPDYGVEVKDGKITVDLSKDDVALRDNKFRGMTKSGLQDCVDEAKDLMSTIEKRWSGHTTGSGIVTKRLMAALEDYIENYDGLLSRSINIMFHGSPLQQNLIASVFPIGHNNKWNNSCR